MQDILEAINTIKNGGVVAHLTDTIWGLAADPRNESAAEKIQLIKKRPEGKSFIVLISEIGQLYDYVEKIPEIAWDIVDMAEEPLTVIYPKGKNLPKNVLAEDGSIGIRLVKNKECLKFLSKCKHGLISTSANLSGEASPLKYNQINPSILNEVDYILTTEHQTPQKASKIIKLGLDGSFKLIRG